MSIFAKIDNAWVSSSAVYKKQNGSWIIQTESDAITYIQNNVIDYGGVIGGIHSLSIGGASIIATETCEYVVLYDNQQVTTGVVWSITAGSQYATINSNGLLTVLQGANNSNVTINCSYAGLETSKNIVVTYVSGASSETETETEIVVDPETGQTTETTTTTTTTTDEQGNTTIETTTTEIITNEDGSSSYSETEEIVNSDGSSTSNTTTMNYDENGDVTGSSTNETNVNADGSSTSSTVNYDASGDPTDAENVATDTSGNVDTQDIEYQNGEPVVTGYTIDTSGNPDGEKDITGNGVDTEFTPFTAGNGFECHIVFRTVKTEQPNPPIVQDTEDTGSNYLFNILTAKSPFKPYRGFHIRWALSKKNYSSGNLVFGYTSSNASSTTSRTLYGVNDVYDITFIYDPLLQKYPSKFRVISNQGTFATVTANINFESNELEFLLGYAINQNDQPYRYANVQIYEFSINKL